MQAIALGELSSLDDAREVVSASFQPKVYEPQQSAAWQEARERFDEIAAVPRPLEDVAHAVP